MILKYRKRWRLAFIFDYIKSKVVDKCGSYVIFLGHTYQCFDVNPVFFFYLQGVLN